MEQTAQQRYDEVRKAGDMNRTLAVIDSMEKARVISTAKADNWRAFAYDSGWKRRIAHCYLQLHQWDACRRSCQKYVARLLKTTDDPISLIGELSGISSRATLSRLFRNTYGMTCSEFRQAARAEAQTCLEPMPSRV